MDPEQILELRRWARGLEGSGDSAELRAAARAILLLADEVDRLRGELALHDQPARRREPIDGAERALLPEADRVGRAGVWGSLKAPWSRRRASLDAEL
jgi:hypothetical protein